MLGFFLVYKFLASLKLELQGIFEYSISACHALAAIRTKTDQLNSWKCQFAPIFLLQTNMS